MTPATGSARTHAGRPSLVRRTLTRGGASGLELVDWSPRSVKITEQDGRAVFAADDVEAPIGWSNLAVAVVARRYFA